MPACSYSPEGVLSERHGLGRAPPPEVALKLTRVDVRFFRSFNFDYEHKARPASKAPEWDNPDHDWYPFVRVAIEPHMTAVVGANEAGKSQLLTAVQAALTGSPIKRSDFCRYSSLFSVQTGEVRYPEFGAIFALDADDDVSNIEALHGVHTFGLYRPGTAAPFVVANGQRVAMDAAEVALLQAKLPTIQVLVTDLALPDKVSIAEMKGEARHVLQDREVRSEFLQVLEKSPGLSDSPTVQKLTEIMAPGKDKASVEAERKRAAEFELARKLLIDIARIDVSAFEQLQTALASGSEGEVEAVIGGMNTAIQDNLNVQRWWSQDQDFDLRVEARERELAFTIQDRTDAKYSFKERSQGLRYFLSYFVQLTAHRMQNGKADILLLDEPDAYLSSVGQQDLLRVLNNYAIPEDDGPQSQVIYVTHSPFLIDKNAPHIIRVLDKGAQDEGTRVVNDAANNRYEPLRSSLGSHLSETAFIGGRNLFVEGVTEQILLTGVSTHIAKVSPTALGVLDLNKVTVVACGGADSVPYMVYLARGRDAVKPPCVALVDGDPAGVEAERVLKKGEARRKRVLKDEFIMRLDVWAQESDLAFDPEVAVKEIEDLIPLVLLHRAALNFLARFQDLSAVDTAAFSVKSLRAAVVSEGGSTAKGLESAYKAAFPEEHLEKAGVAREVVNLIWHDERIEGADELRERIGSLLSVLLEKLDRAAEEEDSNRYDDRLKRAVGRFMGVNRTGMRKNDARRLMAELEHSLSESTVADRIRATIQEITREYELKDPGAVNVPRFLEFREEVGALRLAERTAYQDDAFADPAAQVLDAAGTE